MNFPCLSRFLRVVRTVQIAALGTVLGAFSLFASGAGTAAAAGAAASAAQPVFNAPAWSFNWHSDEGKSYFYPLRIPEAPTTSPSFVSFRPADHKWHLGLWFSWKHINGVNFWEPDKRAKIRLINHRENHAPSAKHALDTFASEIAYEAKGAEIVREKRLIRVETSPAGNYTIRWEAEFTAVADKVVFDRSKPGKNKRTGIWESGGYAGLNLRFTDEPAFRYEFKNAEGLANAAACGHASKLITALITATGKTAAGTAKTAAGSPARVRLTFRDLSAPAGIAGAHEPPPPVWFVRHQPGAHKGRGYYVLGSAPLFHAPLTLKRGETLRLCYEIAVERLP